VVGCGLACAWHVMPMAKLVANNDFITLVFIFIFIPNVGFII
jgi:hypothetical protein